MWIFSSAGLFSVVQADVADDVVIRARFRDDLDRLRTQYLPTLGRTRSTPRRDYPYRAFVSKEQFGAALKRMAADIDYRNFKNRIADEFGEERHDLYLEVWAILRRASMKRNRRGG